MTTDGSMYDFNPLCSIVLGGEFLNPKPTMKAVKHFMHFGWRLGARLIRLFVEITHWRPILHNRLFPMDQSSRKKWRRSLDPGKSLPVFGPSERCLRLWAYRTKASIDSRRQIRYQNPGFSELRKNTRAREARFPGFHPPYF